MNNYERKQLKRETTFEVCNNVYTQCLQEIVNLIFTLNIRKLIRRLLICYDGLLIMDNGI